MSKLFIDADLASDAVSKSTFRFKQRKWTEKDWDDCLNDEIKQVKEEEDIILSGIELREDGLFGFLKEDN